MKNIIAFIFVVYGGVLQVCGQYDAYAGQYLGWIKMYKFKGAVKPLTIDEKTYSIPQLSIIDSFANWMQASYTPRGGLGDIIKYVTPKKNLYHEKYNTAVPHSYGARAATYVYLKKVNGKWTPENNLGISWNIAANEIPMNYRLMDFNTEKTCLFTIPGYDQRVISEQPQSDEAKEERTYNLSADPQVSKYIHYHVPRFGSILRVNMVILSKDNRPPFIPVRIGEALQRIEEALPVKQAEEQVTINEKYPNSPGDKDFFTKKLQERFAAIRSSISRLRQKYSNRLEEKAYTTYGGYTLSDLNNGYDIFTGLKIEEKGSFHYAYPILKVDPELQEGCKTDRPQWIMVKWYGDDLDDPVFRHLHESILANFDFQFLYQFFFDPEKVKGRPYRPLRPPVN